MIEGRPSKEPHGNLSNTSTRAKLPQAYPCKLCKSDVVLDHREDDAWHVRCPHCGHRDILTANRPTAAGRLAGTQLARLADRTDAAWQKQFPEAPLNRCVSCAFRAGTVPNGCEETVAEALDAVLSQTPFLCHMTTDDTGAHTDVCVGWAQAVTAVAKLR